MVSLVEYNKAVNDLAVCFNIDKKEAFYLLDSNLSIAFNRVFIDIIKLDDFLIAKGMKEDESMEDFVIRTYGQSAVQVLLKYM